MISCALHDTIEIVCTFGYEVNLELSTGLILQGKAITTETSKDKKEYLILKNAEELHKVEMTQIKKMTALQPNPHFDSVNF